MRVEACSEEHDEPAFVLAREQQVDPMVYIPTGRKEPLSKPLTQLGQDPMMVCSPTSEVGAFRMLNGRCLSSQRMSPFGGDRVQLPLSPSPTYSSLSSDWSSSSQASTPYGTGQQLLVGSPISDLQRSTALSTSPAAFHSLEEVPGQDPRSECGNCPNSWSLSSTTGARFELGRLQGEHSSSQAVLSPSSEYNRTMDGCLPEPGDHYCPPQPLNHTLDYFPPRRSHASPSNAPITGYERRPSTTHEQTVHPGSTPVFKANYSSQAPPATHKKEGEQPAPVHWQPCAEITNRSTVPVYPLRRRGKVLIVNIEEFQSETSSITPLTKRTGSQQDVRQLCDLFSWAGFTLQVRVVMGHTCMHTPHTCNGAIPLCNSNLSLSRFSLMVGRL